MTEETRKQLGDYEIVRELGHGRSPSPTPAPTPSRQEGCAVLQPRQPERGGRHIGLMLAAAIMILVAVFGGMQVVGKLEAFLSRR